MRHVIAGCVLVAAAFGPSAEAGAAEKDVGFESGLAVGRLSAADRKRMAELPLQDLVDLRTGRYTHVLEDKVMGHWGLDAVLARRELADKPYDLLIDPKGVYQCERIVFADPGTGATMMKLTNSPYGRGGDETNYFGKACWNADGSLMVWQRSREPHIWGPKRQDATRTHGPLLVRGDGTRARVLLAGTQQVKLPICSPVDADRAYTIIWRDLVEIDLRKRTVARTIAKDLPSWVLKLSPDGQYACSKGYSAKSLWVIRLADGKRWDVPLRTAIHDSYRFVPGDTEWVMFWYEGGGLRDEGIRMAHFKTGRQKTAQVAFDWNHGDVGRHVGFHVGGYVTAWDGKTWQPKQHLFWPKKQWLDSGPWYSIPVHAGGYAAHWPDDQLWAHAVTTSFDRAYLSEISRVFAKPLPGGGRVNRFRICFTNLYRRTDPKGRKSMTLARPNISPDGTKILFNSNRLADATVYMVVARKPRRPAAVSAKVTPGGVTVTWKPPEYHREIKGYHVYRSRQSGRGFERISDEPIVGTSCADVGAKPAPGRACFYAVRGVEHSRLESTLSAEAVAGDPGEAPLRVFCEAEDAVRADLDAPSPDALWVNFQATASDLHYVWQRLKDKPGKVSLAVNVPRAGEYTVVARMKGAAGAGFTIGGQEVRTGPSPRWAWARSAGAVRLAAGAQTVEIASSTYGSCLDCFYLAGDADFAPAGRTRAAVPAPLKLTAGPAGPGRARLTWTGDRDRRWYHYNVYCSAKPDAPADRRTLIASPDAETFLDWQAGGGDRYYTVTQVTLDGLESARSNEVRVEVAPPRPATSAPAKAGAD